jgi:hypothetical protein
MCLAAISMHGITPDAVRVIYWTKVLPLPSFNGSDGARLVSCGRRETMIRRPLSVAAALCLTILGSACDDGPTAPSSAAVVTVGVGSETFRVLLTSETQIEAARAAQAGGRARIPNGRIVSGASVNAPWSWHLEDVEFVEVAIELCDGRPSDVEQAGTGFGGGRFCPWTAQVQSIATTD